MIVPPVYFILPDHCEPSSYYMPDHCEPRCVHSLMQKSNSIAITPLKLEQKKTTFNGHMSRATKNHKQLCEVKAKPKP